MRLPSSSVPRPCTSVRLLGAAAALLATLLLAAPARAQDDGLRVQRTWRLLAVGLGVGPELRAQRVLRRAERGLRRELPGLDVRFDVARWQDLPAPPARARASARDGRNDASRSRAGTDTHRPPLASASRLDDSLSDDELVAFAVRELEARGVEPADYDVVFVLSPRYRERYFGHAHIDVTDRHGRAVRAARIHTAPGALVVDGVLGALGDRPALSRTLEVLRPGLVAAIDHGLALEAALLPTIAHELGHFLAPGDLDIRDGYQAPWTRHATGPDDNPDGHGIDCVMYKGRDAAFYARKLVASRGRLVRFCDRCRERLGCSRRRR